MGYDERLVDSLGMIYLAVVQKVKETLRSDQVIGHHLYQNWKPEIIKATKCFSVSRMNLCVRSSLDSIFVSFV